MGLCVGAGGAQIPLESPHSALGAALSLQVVKFHLPRCARGGTNPGMGSSIAPSASLRPRAAPGPTPIAAGKAPPRWPRDTPGTRGWSYPEGA